MNSDYHENLIRNIVFIKSQLYFISLIVSVFSLFSSVSFSKSSENSTWPYQHCRHHRIETCHKNPKIHVDIDIYIRTSVVWMSNKFRSCSSSELSGPSSDRTFWSIHRGTVRFSRGVAGCSGGDPSTSALIIHFSIITKICFCACQRT